MLSGRTAINSIPLERFLLFICLTQISPLAFGYSAVIASSVAPPAIGVAETITVLDRGETALANPSVDYRQALKSVLEGLPSGAQDFVRKDITTFLGRVPGTGADFKCSPEFIRYRARQELERVRTKLLNTNPLPVEPQFCYAVPFVIDLARPTEALEVYGYNLDTQPLELFVVNRDGTFEDVSSALSRRTHYHLTVDLGLNGVKFSPESQMLSVVWGHIIRYSVSLIQSTTALCVSQIEEIPAGKTITYSPLLASGNGHLGSRAYARASTTLNYESNAVDATVCMTVTDQEPDPTILMGCGVEYVYTTEADRVIEGIFSQLEGRTSYIHLNQAQKSIDGRRDGPVSHWIFSIPNAQSGPLIESMVRVVFRKIRIVSTAVDNCLPAIAYLEARRTKVITAGTLKRLDFQSRTIQPEILKLRPRFAPRRN